MQINFPLRFLVLLFIPLTTWAQQLSQIPLTDLSAYQQSETGSWSVCKNISIHPFKSGKVTMEKGTGVLVGKTGSTLTTRETYENLHLTFDFVISPGAKGYITLPGNIKILISDSPSNTTLDNNTIGFTGKVPLQNAGKSPGLWQKLELFYDANLPNQAGQSRINSLKINGVIVQQNIYYKTDNTQPQPLKLTVDNGTIGFRNLISRPLLDTQPLQVGEMTYKRYTDSWNKDTLTKLELQAKAPALTQEYGQGAKEFHLVFEGTMTVDQEGEYLFSYIYTGANGQLEIDGKSVIAYKESTSQEIQNGSIQLSKGNHRFKLRYSKIPWRSAALGLIVEKEGIKPYRLHALSSLPEPDPKPHFSVKPSKQPEMVRSFIAYGDEKSKRTHCLSVGTPEGWHYTMDLNKGALLQVWRGNFANTTEMWYERGEPQLLTSEGLTLPLSGKSSYVLQTDMSSAWPDSSGFDFKGYSLDKDRLPEIRFQKDQTLVYDKMTPLQNGINRTVRVTGSPILLSLAYADRIVQIEKGLFRIDDEYYIKTDSKAKTTLQEIGNKKQLFLTIGVSAGAYSIIW